MSNRRLFGSEHPATMISTASVASALCAQHNFTGAAAMYREVLTVQRRVLGPDHPDTLATASNLGITLFNLGWIGLGNISEAEKLFREVLAAQQRVLGPEHAETLSTAMHLANALAMQNKMANAERIYVQVLGTQKRVLGVEHPHTVMTMTKLSGALLLSGALHSEDALDHMRKLMRVQTSLLGRDHSETVKTAELLAIMTLK